MSPINHTPIAIGAPAIPSTFNSPLLELDAAIGKHNHSATGPPTANDDESDGYHIGSVWVDTTNDTAYICVDATEGAAVWPCLKAVGASAVIGLEVLSGLAATVSFSNIPSTYEALVLQWLVRVNTSSEEMTIRFNDDATVNYEYHCRYLYTGSPIESISADRMVIAVLTAATYAHPSYYASPGTLWIPGYKGTDFYKTLHAHFGDYYSSGSPVNPGGGAGRWKSTSAITKITLGTNGGSYFQVGSRFLLIGIKGEAS